MDSNKLTFREILCFCVLVAKKNSFRMKSMFERFDFLNKGFISYFCTPEIKPLQA